MEIKAEEMFQGKGRHGHGRGRGHQDVDKNVFVMKNASSDEIPYSNKVFW